MEILNISNQIINGKLTPLVLKNVDTIVLHHMAHKTADVKQVENWHTIGNGWTAIGYNYWIGFDGTIYNGRGLNKGAGVTNENSHIINIGFQGDYHSKKVEMPERQLHSAVELIMYLQKKVPNAKNIVGHKHFGGSVCPGQYFPMNEIKELVQKKGESVTVDEAVKILKNKVGLEQGTVDFLLCYKYGDSLVKKIAKKVK